MGGTGTSDRLGCWRRVVKRRSILLAAAALLALAAPAPASAARKKAPELTRIRCVPATSATCKAAVKVTIGRQLQLSGRRISKGMRVSFRWSRGALATKLDRTRVGYVARVPAGTRAGSVSVTVSDRAGRRSNARRITVRRRRGSVVPRPRRARCLRCSRATACGSGSCRRPTAATSRRSPPAPAPPGSRPSSSRARTGRANRWAQFNPELVAALKANGLRACAWQYVYGNDPLGEASLGADAIADGADCLVIDAESEYKGKYAAAQQYIAALRATVGPAYPIGFTSFPYVDYHSTLPYSVFLGPGAAQANLPQVYWKDIGGTVDAVCGRTLAQNRIYGTSIAPLGQTYGGAPPEDIARFRALWAGYGSAGLSGGRGSTRQRPAGPRSPSPSRRCRSRRPTRAGRRSPRATSGDQVVWLQQHLASFDPAVTITKHVRRRDRPGAAQLPGLARPAGHRHHRRADLAGRARPAAATYRLAEDAKQPTFAAAGGSCTRHPPPH